jgi:ferredoxin
MARPLWFVSLLKKYFPYRKKIAGWSRYQPVKKLMSTFLFNGDSMVYLPKDRIVIQESIDVQENIVLPSEIVHHYIDQANHLWIMNHCICRQGEDCQDYPQDLGCLFMGDAVLGINSKLGHEVSRLEAHDHIKKAQDLGLVHLIGRNKLDSIWLGVGPGEKLMTVCNCCPCCCLFKILPDLPDDISRAVTKMTGVNVFVSEDCIGCEMCASNDVCFVEAISMVDGRAVIDEKCRGCGRCVEICEQQAISIEIADLDYFNKTIEIIDKKVDVN